MKRISKYHLKLANRRNFITEWPNGRYEAAHSMGIEQTREKKTNSRLSKHFSSEFNSPKLLFIYKKTKSEKRRRKRVLCLS